MAPPVANVAVLGSTGSIGTSALEVIAAAPDTLRAWALSAHSSCQCLLAQAERFAPHRIVVSDPVAAAEFCWEDLPPQVELLTGPEHLETIAREPEVDVVLAAIVGSAGLRGTWAAVEAGKTVALANKETMVVAGPLVTDLANRTGARIVPVDSEHSAVFQAMQAGRREEVKRIILTASGGPFRRHSAEQLAEVTVEDALRHPTWDMGPKITIDSATMMNKALEIIEARWLFDLEPDQIDVVVHPQSIVHSMVEFVDGSIVAQLGSPDMKLPIQYALTYPRRAPSVATPLDFGEAMSLEFEPPDEERFPALALGREVATSGGTAGAVLNAANEAAVERFRAGELHFTEIVPSCRAVLEQHDFDPSPSLAELEKLDAWARQEVLRWACL
ncbi:MAG: 1-deoxy-D-xylulose-5-phosphate reductoisomerase [Planctomycetota bacterium]|nr:MAG: 1-deoxy-D-xylulose-5-phosphate reductoisomerase [Planctomycetota bacterium]